MSRTPTLNPEVERLLGEIAANVQDVKVVTRDLDDAQFNWRPAPGAWSMSECIAHLNVVDGQDMPPLAQAIEAAKTAGLFDQGPYRYGLLSRWFVRTMEPPPGRLKFKAPPVYAPPAGQPLEKVLTEYLKIQDRFAELVRRSSGVDLKRVKVGTPVNRYLKFSLGQRFALLTAHDRRHLWQAWQVRSHRGFPAGGSSGT